MLTGLSEKLENSLVMKPSESLTNNECDEDVLSNNYKIQGDEDLHDDDEMVSAWLRRFLDLILSCYVLDEYNNEEGDLVHINGVWPNFLTKS